MIKEVLYLGIKSCPHRAATSDLVQRRTLLVYVEDWRMSGLFCGHVSEIVSNGAEFMRLVCSVGPWLGNLSLYWLQTCSAFVKIATQSFIYKKKKKNVFLHETE